MVNFREFETTSGKIVLGGKSAKNNEALVEQISPKEIVLHTAMPGSPFCNIKGDASKKDIKEAAIFCAKYSQDWRNYKKDVLIHIFKGANIYKKKKMELGTYGIKKFKVIKIKKSDILKFEKEFI